MQRGWVAMLLSWGIWSIKPVAYGAFSGILKSPQYFTLTMLRFEKPSGGLPVFSSASEPRSYRNDDPDTQPLLRCVTQRTDLVGYF